MIGSNNSNLGELSIDADVDLTTSSFIGIGNSNSLQAFYTIPKGKTAFMTNITLTTHKIGPVANSMISANLMVRKFTPNGESFLKSDTISAVLQGTTDTQKLFSPHKRFESETDIWLEVDYSSDNNLSISGGFNIVLVDNSLVS